jgi:ABC-type microcin C transport system duplicated ATPase subunit YejF
MTPFPTLEQVFAWVRKEATRQDVMNTGDEAEQHISAAMYSKGHKDIDKSHLKCTHCGMTKHTKDQCFKLVGYTDWFKERRKEKGNWLGRGHAAITRANLALCDNQHVPISNYSGAGTAPGGAGITSSGGAGSLINFLGAGTWYRAPIEQAGTHPGNHIEASSNRIGNKIQHVPQIS